MPTIPDYASKNSYDRVQQKQDTDSSYLIILNYMHNLSLLCQFWSMQIFLLLQLKPPEDVPSEIF